MAHSGLCIPVSVLPVTCQTSTLSWTGAWENLLVQLFVSSVGEMTQSNRGSLSFVITATMVGIWAAIALSSAFSPRGHGYASHAGIRVSLWKQLQLYSGQQTYNQLSSSSLRN